MKFAVLVVAAGLVGAIGAVAVPSTVLDSGTSSFAALERQVGQSKLADLNPLRAIFDYEQERIRRGYTPEELGLRPSDTSTLKLYQFPDNNFTNQPSPRRGNASDMRALLRDTPQ